MQTHSEMLSAEHQSAQGGQTEDGRRHTEREERMNATKMLENDEEGRISSC